MTLDSVVAFLWNVASMMGAVTTIILLAIILMALFLSARKKGE